LLCDRGHTTFENVIFVFGVAPSLIRVWMTRLVVKGGVVSEESSSAAYEVLRAQLQGLRVRAGRPTYRELAGAWRSEKGAPTGPEGRPVTLFAVSTIGDNLNGNRTSRFMSWPFVRFFVLACERCARRQGIELSVEDRDLRPWWDRWQAHLPEPGPHGGGPPLPGVAPLRVVRLGEGRPGSDGRQFRASDNGRSIDNNVRSSCVAVTGGRSDEVPMALTGSGCCPQRRQRMPGVAVVPDEELPMPGWMAQVLAQYVRTIPAQLWPRRVVAARYGAGRARQGRGRER
jgi:hypothetical protein